MKGILRLDRFLAHIPAELLMEYFKRRDLVPDTDFAKQKLANSLGRH